MRFKTSLSLFFVISIGYVTVKQANGRLGSRKWTIGEPEDEKESLSHRNMEEKYNTLARMKSASNVISLTSSEFDSLILKSPKNYSTIVFVIDESSPCRDCKDALKALEKVAQLYNSMNAHLHEELFFVRVDYYDAPGILDHVTFHSSNPSVLYFPTDSNFGNIRVMDFKKYSISSPDSIATWIRDLTGIIVRSSQNNREKANYSNTTVLILALFLFVKFNWNALKNYTESGPKYLVAAVIALLSGQMYNHIRGSPIYIKGSNTIMIVYPSTQSQTVLESFIVFMLISAGTFGLITMIDGATERLKSKRKEVGWNEVLGSACYFFSVCGLMSMKNLKMN